MSVLKDRVSELIAQHGSLRAAARVLMVDPGYLSRLGSGEKDDPGEDLLRRMKLRRVVSHESTASTGPAQSDLLAAARCAQNVLFLLADEVKALGCHAGNVREMLCAAIDQASHCPYCDGTGDVHGLDGEWRGRCEICEMEVLRHERDHARLQNEHLIKVLFGIYALLSPPDYMVGGKTYRFVNPDANETLRSLTAAIKAIPEELDRARSLSGKGGA